MNFSPNPTILKGTPTTTEQINSLIGVSKENSHDTFLLNNESFSGNQYSPSPHTGQVLFVYDTDSTTGLQRLKSVCVDTCIISLGGFGTNEQGKIGPDVEIIEQTFWTRKQFTDVVGENWTGSISIYLCKNKDGSYRFAFSTIDED